MGIEIIQPNAIAVASTMIKLTPDQLRAIASRMETHAKNAMPGQVITYQITKSVTIYYDPEITVEKLEQLIKSAKMDNVTVAIE